MKQLYESLSRRKRPEDVADRILTVLGDDLSPRERKLLERAARGALRRRVWAYSSMLQDFARPVGLKVQIAKAQILFGSAYALSDEACDDPDAVEAFLRHVGEEIAKSFGRSDFLSDRLNRAARESAGIEPSRRKYNRKFRMLTRMERKLRRLVRERRKYELTRVGKSGLATHMSWDVFSASASSACFVAYYAARSNLRSEFTVAGQQKAFDEIAKMLFERCLRDPRASFWAIAQIYPAAPVLARLDDQQKGTLLGRWFDVLADAGDLLRELAATGGIDRRTMIVRRGNDSTTWNNTANAWNQARDHWIALIHAMNMDSMLDAFCPGKVLRLMAADVARWHRAVGGGLDPDTLVWADLPAPWDVLDGLERCGRARVETVCRRHGVDPVARGWSAPRPPGKVARYRPTPELVHGVAVASPQLAGVLRQAGWFSGKKVRGSVHEPLHRAIAGAHAAASERRRRAGVEREDEAR